MLDAKSEKSSPKWYEIIWIRLNLLLTINFSTVSILWFLKENMGTQKHLKILILYKGKQLKPHNFLQNLDSIICYECKALRGTLWKLETS